MITKDYIKNKEASQEMADNIRDFYHKKGYTQVKTWVEEHIPISNFGTKLPANYFVRGNIVFRVDSIKDGMIE